MERRGFDRMVMLDNWIREIVTSYFPQTGKEFLLIVVSMRLMWIGLNILTSIVNFLNNKFHRD